MGNKDKL